MSGEQGEKREKPREEKVKERAGRTLLLFFLHKILSPFSSDFSSARFFRPHSTGSSVYWLSRKQD